MCKRSKLVNNPKKKRIRGSLASYLEPPRKYNMKRGRKVLKWTKDADLTSPLPRSMVWNIKEELSHLARM